MSVNYLNDVRAEARTLRELFAIDPSRAQRYVAQVADLRIDWSRQPVTDEVLGSLRSAAQTAGVCERFRALAGGQPVNVTEGRAALHIALRAEKDATFEVDGRNVMAEVHAELTRMGAFAEKVRANPEVTDIVNIGIGGSDLVQPWLLRRWSATPFHVFELTLCRTLMLQTSRQCSTRFNRSQPCSSLSQRHSARWRR